MSSVVMVSRSALTGGGKSVLIMVMEIIMLTKPMFDYIVLTIAMVV